MFNVFSEVYLEAFIESFPKEFDQGISSSLFRVP